MNLTEEQILDLAPDEPSKKNGKALASAAKWVSKGVNEKALWGECQGSGSKPYQAQVDLSAIAFKCSCPSRKFPCKHGLGLMLLYAKDKAAFTDNAMPAWVEEWVSKRAVKQEKKEEEKSKPVDEAAQAKRAQAREQKVSDGIAELLLWMKDLIRNGIMAVPEKGTATFENMAKRMIDAQAPGLAGMLRFAGNINFYTEGWQSQLLDQLARMYLVISGFKNIETIAPALQQDIKSFIGFTQSQDALAEQAGVNDHWLILSKEVTQDDNLATERFWLYGIQTKRYALVLQFSVRGQGGQLSLAAGTTIQAELAFYPSVQPLRAIIKRQIAAGHHPQPAGYKNWDEVLGAQAEAFNALPFKSASLYIIEQVRPVYHKEKWWLQDTDQRLMPLNTSFKNIWLLLSLTGGEFVTMSVNGIEKEFYPLGLWDNGVYKTV